MANPYGQPPQPPFTPAEKRFLLGEIIKYYAPNQDYLWQVASNLIPQFPPRLEDMPMPQGRSLNEGIRALEEISGIRRTSAPQQTPLMRSMTSQSTSPGSAPPPAKRPYTLAFEQPYSGVKIAPKPSSSTANVYGQQSSVEQPPKKKRGRPTKAEAQAKAEAQSTSGDAGPASKSQIVETSLVRPPPPARPPEPLTIETPRPEEMRTAQVARMSVSSMLTPTGPKSNSQSSSSSGKRRRGRSTRSEPEDLLQFGEASSGQAQEYESPYATRMGAEPQDSPARTAVLRHRDDADSRTTFPGAQSPSAQETPTTGAPPTTGAT